MTEPSQASQARAVGRVRTDLADIAALHARLGDEALEHPNADIPGGTPAILGGPWSPGEPGHVADETGTPTPPLLVLATWEDAARDILGWPEGPRPATVPTAVEWLSDHLAELTQHDAWDQLANEIRAVRIQLENALNDGNRPVRGVRCLNPDCTAELRRHYAQPVPCRHWTPAKSHARALIAEARQRRYAVTLLGYPAHLGYPTDLIPLGAVRAALRAARRPCQQCDQGGRRDTWVCPACRRTYDDDEYRTANAQDAAELDPRRTAADIARTLGVRPGRIRLWAHRRQLVPVAHTANGRPLYDIRQARRLAMRDDVA